MLSPRAMFPEGEAALAEHGKDKAVRPELDILSSAPTRCPTSELLAFGDDQDADARKESRGATALPRDGDEPALLQMAPLEAVLFGDGHHHIGSAMSAPRVAPLRRLRSEAFWEQKAAAARLPARSPWELGVRQRRPCLDERESCGPAAVATPAAEGAEVEGAVGSSRSWAGAVSREFARGRSEVAWPVVPPRWELLGAAKCAGPCAINGQRGARCLLCDHPPARDDPRTWHPPATEDACAESLTATRELQQAMLFFSEGV
ncbi:unnamed protein product [Prorocentrum cordatum]|uniref:Uncharacterized protein n=1 Tax=Prorocentrum cordatum TaxID=2364126 RepID=A0ABN9VGB1_9DINO|nr:unnamed protein product [Polarella glacialis]